MPVAEAARVLAELTGDSGTESQGGQTAVGGSVGQAHVRWTTTRRLRQPVSLNFKASLSASCCPCVLHLRCRRKRAGGGKHRGGAGVGDGGGAAAEVGCRPASADGRGLAAGARQVGAVRARVGNDQSRFDFLWNPPVAARRPALPVLRGPAWQRLCSPGAALRIGAALQSINPATPCHATKESKAALTSCNLRMNGSFESLFRCRRRRRALSCLTSEDSCGAPSQGSTGHRFRQWWSQLSGGWGIRGKVPPGRLLCSSATGIGCHLACGA